MVKGRRNISGICNKEIAEQLRVDRSTVSWHIQQFLDEEIVISRGDGRNTNYFICPEVEDILMEYRK
jgi:predicted transcriptional regulator